MKALAITRDVLIALAILWCAWTLFARSMTFVRAWQ